jgi:hypothetical protein
MTSNGRPHFGEIFNEVNQATVLYVGSGPGVILMVNVLPPPGAVLTDGLQPAQRRRVDDHFSPCRRNPQTLDSGEVLAGNSLSIRSLIPESARRRAGSKNSVSL